jgi:hypothetical protein
MWTEGAEVTIELSVGSSGVDSSWWSPLNVTLAVLIVEAEEGENEGDRRRGEEDDWSTEDNADDDGEEESVTWSGPEVTMDDGEMTFGSDHCGVLRSSYEREELDEVEWSRLDVTDEEVIDDCGVVQDESDAPDACDDDDDDDDSNSESNEDGKGDADDEDELDVGV